VGIELSENRFLETARNGTTSTKTILKGAEKAHKTAGNLASSTKKTKLPLLKNDYVVVFMTYNTVQVIVK